MKFIVLNGSPCSGKSTLAKRIIEERDHFYRLSYDSQKWLFSHYKPDTHFEDVMEILAAITEKVCELNYNVVCSSVMYRSTRERLLGIAKKHGYEILEINLSAPFEMLEKRFEERVARALEDPRNKTSNTSKERFKQIYSTYEQEKNPNAITLRTDRDVDVTVSELLKII